eukprot:GILI01005596.1.p1 GENE.GILI01005596.1~~GILI01005596.1.p1  ORF type:complete len:392 (+),score=101.46 GILI01005596.1:99-1274(+)
MPMSAHHNTLYSPSVNSPNSRTSNHFGSSGIVDFARQENHSPPLPVNCAPTPRSFSLMWQSGNNSPHATNAHTPTASSTRAKPNLFSPISAKSHFSVASESTDIHSNSQTRSVFNNTDPHTVHTEQSNAMPNHGRNVHEGYVANISRYAPYASTVAKSPKRLSSSMEDLCNVPDHHHLHRSLSSIHDNLNSCAFSSASAESTCAIDREENHCHQQVTAHHYRHDPYAVRHTLRASCLPFERIEHAKADIQAVIVAVCGENFNVIVESVQKAPKGHCLEVTIRTSHPNDLADKLAEAVVLMDRNGFHVADGNVHPQQALLDYCEHVRNLPQQERHWRLDGLPCSSAGFRVDGIEARHGNNRGDKNYRQAHIARTQHRPTTSSRFSKAPTPRR